MGLPEGGHGGHMGPAGKKAGLEHASSGHSSFSTAQPALAHSITQTRRWVKHIRPEVLWTLWPCMLQIAGCCMLVCAGLSKVIGPALLSAQPILAFAHQLPLCSDLSACNPEPSSTASAVPHADGSVQHAQASKPRKVQQHEWSLSCRAGAQLGIRTKAASKALQTHDAWPPELAFPDGDRTPEDCGVTTPDCPLEELRLYGSWDRGGRSGAAFHLPSHISAFGDGLHLPSYISAFGDGARCCSCAVLVPGLVLLAVSVRMVRWRMHEQWSRCTAALLSSSRTAGIAAPLHANVFNSPD